MCISILSNAIGINDTLQLKHSFQYHHQDSGFLQDTLTKQKVELQSAVALPKDSCTAIPAAAAEYCNVASIPVLHTMAWKPPCSVAFALLEAVIQSGFWSSRASYAVLQAILLGGHLSPEQVSWQVL